MKSGSLTARTIFAPMAAVLFLIAPGVGTASAAPQLVASAAPAPVSEDCNYFLDSNLADLSVVRWAHIQAPKHNWRRFGYVTQGQVSASIRNALVNGNRYRYGLKLSACQAQVVEYEPNRKPHTITVTYQVLAKRARISDAWIQDVG